MSRRPYRNGPEEKFASLAEANGWEPTKRGWPDFLCFGPDGEIIAVEVKPRIVSGRLQLLKRSQAAVLDLLTEHGVRCYVSDGETLEPYSREAHASEKTRNESRTARLKRVDSG